MASKVSVGYMSLLLMRKRSHLQLGRKLQTEVFRLCKMRNKFLFNNMQQQIRWLPVTWHLLLMGKSHYNKGNHLKDRLLLNLDALADGKIPVRGAATPEVTSEASSLFRSNRHWPVSFPSALHGLCMTAHSQIPFTVWPRAWGLYTHRTKISSRTAFCHMPSASNYEKEVSLVQNILLCV